MNISEVILPNCSIEPIDIYVKQNEQSYKLVTAIEKHWESNRNIAILGEGGMGKTVSLIHIWKIFLSIERNKWPIPFFISLEDYNMYDENIHNDFIFQNIKKKYLEDDTEKFEEFKKYVHKPISKAPYIPSILLLLDGINEVVRKKDRLLYEIDNIVEHYEGIQIIVTSRYDLKNAFGWEILSKLYLQRISSEHIYKYLEQYNVDANIDSKLLKILGNPMMLTIYTSTSSIFKKYNVNFDSELYTQGELLDRFIHAQKVLISSSKKDEEENKYRIFLIDFIVPYLAHYMETRGIYSINEYKTFEKCIKEALADYMNESFFHNNEKFRAIADKFIVLRKASDMEYVLIVKEIESIICEEMAFMIIVSGEYRFLHQHFRDFFTAKYIINDIDISLNIGMIPESLNTRILSYNVRRFVGEMLKEYEYFKNDSKKYREGKLAKTLNHYKEKYNDGIENGICNVINIITSVRNDISNLDLTYLNLRGVHLKNIICSNHAQMQYTNFSYSIIDDDTFFDSTHHHEINSIYYLGQQEAFATISPDGMCKVWNINTGKKEFEYTPDKGWIHDVCYIKKQNSLVTAHTQRSICIYNLSERKILYFNDFRHIVKAVCLNKSETMLFSISWDNTIKLWNLIDYELIDVYRVNNMFPNSISYSTYKDTIVVGYNDGELIEYNLKKNKINEVGVIGRGTNSLDKVAYIDNWSTILTVSNDNLIQIWDVASKRILANFKYKSINCIDFIENIIYIGTSDSYIICWDYKKNMVKKHFVETPVLSIKVIEDIDVLIITDEKYFIKVLNLGTFEVKYVIENGIANKISDIYYDYMQTNILILSNNDCIREIDASKGRLCNYHFASSENIQNIIDRENDMLGFKGQEVALWDKSKKEIIGRYKKEEFLKNNKVTPNLSSIKNAKDIKRIEIKRDLKFTYCDISNKKIEFFDKNYINRWTYKKISIKEDNKEGINRLVRKYIDENQKGKMRKISSKKALDGDVIKAGGIDKLIEQYEDAKKVDDNILFEDINETCLYIPTEISLSISEYNISNDHTLFLCIFSDGTVQVWNLNNYEKVSQFKVNNLKSLNKTVINSKMQQCVCVFDFYIEVWSIKESVMLFRYSNVNGLYINKCEMKNLNKMSNLREEKIELLIQEGAIFD